MREKRAVAPGARSLGGDLRAPGCQAVASSFQTTAIQTAGAVTMVTIAKAFPAWYVLGAAWMWMWVADFLGVGDGRGRKQADCVYPHSSQAPPTASSGTSIPERSPGEKQGGSKTPRVRGKKKSRVCGVSGQFQMCTQGRGPPPQHNVPAVQACSHPLPH